MKTIASACYRAAKLVTRGWIQEAYAYFPSPKKRKATCYCMSGAINTVCNGPDSYATDSPYSHAVHGFISSWLLQYQTVVNFNDQPGMTSEDAVACLTMAGDIATFEGV